MNAGLCHGRSSNAKEQFSDTSKFIFRKNLLIVLIICSLLRINGLDRTEKEKVVRWSHVEGYPGPVQEIDSEGSYGNFTSSVVGREVSFCARETSVTFTK